MASKYIQKFPVPENFPEILHDLSKEILRNQPEDIIEFCALYFKCLQEGIVLDYPKRGQNIPCDFKTGVPKLTKATDKKKISREEEDDHKKALEKITQEKATNSIVDEIKEDEKKVEEKIVLQIENEKMIIKDKKFELEYDNNLNIKVDSSSNTDTLNEKKKDAAVVNETIKNSGIKEYIHDFIEGIFSRPTNLMKKATIDS
jgi:hypothetical protein